MKNVHRRKVHNIWHTVRKEYISAFFLFVISTTGQLWKIVNSFFFFLNVFLEFKDDISINNLIRKTAISCIVGKVSLDAYYLELCEQIPRAWKQPKHQGGKKKKTWGRSSFWGCGNVCPDPPEGDPLCGKGKVRHYMFLHTRAKVELRSGKEITLILPWWVPRFLETLS